MAESCASSRVPCAPSGWPLGENQSLTHDLPFSRRRVQPCAVDEIADRRLPFPAAELDQATNKKVAIAVVDVYWPKFRDVIDGLTAGLDCREDVEASMAVRPDPGEGG